MVGDVETPETGSPFHRVEGGGREDNRNEFLQKVDVDHILKRHTGNIGFVQIAITTISALTLPAAVVFPVFGNTELPHRCRMDQATENRYSSQFNYSTSDSFDAVAALVGPWPSSTQTSPLGNGEFGCQRYRNPLMPPITNQTQLATIPCNNGYVYKFSSEQYPGGIVNEWDLVCDQAWKVPFSTAMYMGGMLLGYVGGGLAGDRFGRRLTALIACIFEGLATIAVSLSPNFWFYIVFRVSLACSSSVKIAVLLVLCMEMTTAHQRSLISGIWAIIQGFVLRILLSPLAYWFPDWRWFHGILCMGTFFSFPSIFLFPESPRWLVSQHRKVDALHQLYKIHRVNLKMNVFKKKALAMTEEDFVRRIQEEASMLKTDSSKPAPPPHPPQSQFRQMLKTFKARRMARTTVQCVLLFSGQLATTFGLIFYASIVRANIYLVNVLNSTTQIPATIISGLMYRYCKRRKIPIMVMYMLSLIILAIASIYNWVVKPESDFVLNICCNLALILLAAALNMVFMYVPELFPSESRALGLGMASGLGRVGGIICPFVNALDSVIFHSFPIIIYMAILLLEMLNLFWLPDTSGRNLLDNLEQKKEVEAEDEGDESGEENVRDSGDVDEEDGQPIWASTLDELIASTHVIRSTTDIRDVVKI
ncbi:Solute carrier family 22 member 6-A [Taenia crassiceps]|uniref:Solute carrier family 22 member 6-A n=1 Tax=Taenia crassiceps TaxID=6207 RepID=A0ABR4QJE6_9CEST